ncbi:hypothetical protein OJAV_G00117900 [Oryzias javanicus]|uniref:Uncharacterized protein n=1 Tax=Oryzias javanicus TaxID=123683 RepID=A0A437CRP3_ORYJA|nr:hypothetical protein OJAV_G00117900 [Oryzias javanicus]
MLGEEMDHMDWVEAGTESDHPVIVLIFDVFFLNEREAASEREEKRLSELVCTWEEDKSGENQEWTLKIVETFVISTGFLLESIWILAFISSSHLPSSIHHLYISTPLNSSLITVVWNSRLGH